MGVSVNTNELLKILELTPASQNIMLVGRHGVGKSRIITDFFEGRGQKVVTLFLGQMSDPGDIIGLPALDATPLGEKKGGRTVFYPPWWFPLDGKPIVLFLDELNRARPEILQCVMDLTLNKTLAGRSLPEGSRVLSAVNEGEEYQLTDLDPALVSRFNVYYFTPTAGEWLLWAASHDIDKRVIDFIEKNSDCLDSKPDEDAAGGLEKGADRRSWERVSALLAPLAGIDRVTEKALAGIVGSAAALRLSRFLREKAGINPADILKNFAKEKPRLEKLAVHELSPVNEGLFRVMELEEKQDSLKTYAANLEEYIKWLDETKRTEALAHWTTLFDSASYPKAKLAVMSYSPFIFQHIVDFIKRLKV
jgi:hypothetical protein